MFLEENFNNIEQAIREVWSNKEGLQINSIGYDSLERKIDVSVTYHNMDIDLTYFEKNHNKSCHDGSMASFLDDLNTDVSMTEIMMLYPALEITGFSWPD